IGGVVLVSLFGRVRGTQDARFVNLPEQLRPPGSAHLFGTDSAGMDIFSRVLYGGRLALGSGLVILLLSTVTGSFLGSLAGYFGGPRDPAVQRVAHAFPGVPRRVLCFVG